MCQHKCMTLDVWLRSDTTVQCFRFHAADYDNVNSEQQAIQVEENVTVRTPEDESETSEQQSDDDHENAEFTSDGGQKEIMQPVMQPEESKKPVSAAEVGIYWEWWTLMLDVSSMYK